MEWLWSRNTVLFLFCGCLATAWMTHGAPQSSRKLGPGLRLTRQVNNSSSNSSEDATTTSSGDTWLGANWYWLLVLLVAVFVFVLLAIICCCYKQSTSLSPTGRMQLSSMKTALPSPSLTGFTSPISTSPGDRENYHGNLVVSPGILSTEQTPVASPQLQFTSLSQKQQQQYSPHNSTASRYSYRRKNQSPANSSGSEETIRHATGTPSISSFTSVSSSLNGKMSRAQSFTGVGQPRLSRRRSGSQVKVISLSRGTSSLSMTSTASNSSAHSGASNQSTQSHGAYQSDSSRHTYLAVDVQVRAVGEMTQHEKNMYAAVVLAESAAKLAQSAASYGEEPIVPTTKSHKMRTSHTGRRYYSTAAGLRQANDESPTKTPPSYSQSMPISHSIHFSKQINLPTANPLHGREDPVISLDNCVRDEHCGTKKKRLTSLSSNDTGDELFTPKQSFTGTIDIIRPPASSHHRSQQNSSSEKDRGRVKKSKTGTDEVKKKKRHTHQSVPTSQACKLSRFVGDEAPEMPVHTRNTCLPTDQPLDDNTAQPTSEKQLTDSPINLPSGNTKEQASNNNNNHASANGHCGDKEEENHSHNKEEEKTQKKMTIPSLGSSGKLKRTSVSISLSSSLSSGINELNQSKQGLKRQCSVPNIPQSTSLSHASHISRPPSGTSVSASGYGASMDSASSVDSVNTLSKPSEYNTTFSYPLRKLLEGEQDRRGATDLQFSVNDHQTSGTSSAASSGMAEKAPLSPALPFISTNGFSVPYRNPNHETSYNCLPSVTGLASAEV